MKTVLVVEDFDYFRLTSHHHHWPCNDIPVRGIAGLVPGDVKGITPHWTEAPILPSILISCDTWDRARQACNRLRHWSGSCLCRSEWTWLLALAERRCSATIYHQRPQAKPMYHNMWWTSPYYLHPPSASSDFGKRAVVWDYPQLAGRCRTLHPGVVSTVGTALQYLVGNAMPYTIATSRTL